MRVASGYGGICIEVLWFEKYFSYRLYFYSFIRKWCFADSEVFPVFSPVSVVFKGLGGFIACFYLGSVLVKAATGFGRSKCRLAVFVT